MSDTAATLNGTVAPNKESTTYHFEYGTTTAYGTATTAVSAGGGNATKNASTTVTGLAPSTTYHYRLVATNASGTVPGADITFTTFATGQVAPTPTLTFTASPLTVIFGSATRLRAALKNVPTIAGQQIELKENPYPFTGGFKPLATALTNTSGVATFTVRPALHTQYQTTAKQPGNDLTGAIVQVGVRSYVSLGLSDSTPRKGQRVRFRGSVKPAHNGALVYIQKRSSTGKYRTIARTTLRAVTGGLRSSYSKTIRIYSSGRYRAMVKSHADHHAGFKVRSITVH